MARIEHPAVEDYTPLLPVGEGARGDGAHRRRGYRCYERWTYGEASDCKHLANMAAAAFTGKRVKLVDGLVVRVKGWAKVRHSGNRCQPCVLVSTNSAGMYGDVWCNVHSIVAIVD
jgi:hypothetical protein